MNIERKEGAKESRKDSEASLAITALSQKRLESYKEKKKKTGKCLTDSNQATAERVA